MKFVTAHKRKNRSKESIINEIYYYLFKNNYQVTKKPNNNLMLCLKHKYYLLHDFYTFDDTLYFEFKIND